MKLRFYLALLLALVAWRPMSAQLVEPAEKRGTGKAAIQTLRLGVVGASISAGVSSDLRLAQAMTSNLDPKLVKLESTDTANMMTFMSPESFTNAGLKRIAAAEGLQGMIAIDYLFWFVYGTRYRSFDARSDSLAKGLAKLEAFEIPIWLGDIPHITDANRAMLSPKAVPPADEIAKFNTQVKTWAKTRKNITVLPVKRWLEALKNGKPIEELSGAPVFERKDILARDKLHLSKKGVLIAAHLTLREVAKSALLSEQAVQPWNKVLGVAEKTAMSVEVRVEKGSPAKLHDRGYITFRLDSSGMSFEKLAQLAGLQDLLDAIPIKGANPYVVKQVASVARELKKIEVRGFDGELVAPWQSIKLAEGKRSKIVLAMETGRQLRVKVVDGSGKPIPKAEVTSFTELRDRGWDPDKKRPRPFAATSDALGSATLKGLLPGKHEVRVVLGARKAKQTFEVSESGQEVTIVLE